VTAWSAAFAADLHLAPVDREGVDRAVALVGLCRARTGRLYLLGDVFDLWVSAAMLRVTEFAPLYRALREAAAAGLATTFLPGNRDFNLTPADGRALGVAVVDEDHPTRVDGEDLWLTHGDGFLTGDRSYQRYKRVIRSRPLRALARRLPAPLALHLARRLRRYSARAVPAKDPARLAIDPARVRACLDRGARRVLCGHVHRAARVDHGAGRELLVLPPFVEQGEFLVLSGGEFHLGRLDGTLAPFAPGSGAPRP